MIATLITLMSYYASSGATLQCTAQRSGCTAAAGTRAVHCVAFAKKESVEQISLMYYSIDASFAIKKVKGV